MLFSVRGQAAALNPQQSSAPSARLGRQSSRRGRREGRGEGRREGRGEGRREGRREGMLHTAHRTTGLSPQGR